MISLKEITCEYINSLKNIEKEILRNIKIPEVRDIKAIIGPRRVGKTYLLLKKARELLNQNKQVIYISFDEPLFRNIDVREFAKLVRKEFPEGNIHLFLDEIQDWKNWDFNLRWLYEMKDFNIYISGSSSSLLSSEIPSRLRGRYISTEILPFSFKEICSYEISDFRSRGKILNLFDQYLEYGGFPEIWLERSREKIISILETIFYRDILERYNIRDKMIFRNFFDFVIRNYSAKITYNSLSKLLCNVGISLDPKTVSNYIKYMEESYLLFLLEPFSYSYKTRINLPKKVYLVDTCFCNLYDFSKNLGRKLENIVFVELIRRFGRENVYYFYDPEVDFVVVEKGKVKHLIQVCFETHEKNVIREIDNLLKVSEEIGCDNLCVITYDQEKEIDGVKLVPCWKFLLEIT